jgi:tetratricopeptide (TPR) repeat protein
MEYRHQEVVKLNQIGIELYHLHKVLPASFHFNEALSLLSKIAADREQQKQFNKCNSPLSDRTKIEATPISGNKLPRSLLQPLAVDPSLPSTQPADWDRIYALTILHNIALTNYAMNCFPKAERMLRLALRLLSEEYQNHRLRHFDLSGTAPGRQCNDFYLLHNDEQLCPLDIYSYVDLDTSVVLMSIYHLLGIVISQTSGRTLREALECFIEAIHASRRQLGGHVLVAGVFVSLGRVMIRDGFIEEASYAYDMAKCIYSTLQAGESGTVDLGCTGAPAA